ncbi:MAG: hypothetical protein IKQ22_01030 [Clostridia bacterium]|nr:hypothetical protein [Clostridia bacterium]
MPEAKFVSSEALDAYTQALSQKLNSKLSNIYTPKGSAIYADTAYLASANKASPSIDSVGLWQQINGNWTKLTEVMPGWVYNITNEFTTDANFVDGGDISPAVGTNIVVINVGTTQNPSLKFDLLATGVAFDPAVIATKQDKIMSAEPEIVIADLTYADATARTADTTTNVSDGDIAYQEDTEEYYYAEVSGTTIIWHDIGNTKTVEGAIKLIGSIVPIKPISTTEIQAMFASS